MKKISGVYVDKQGFRHTVFFSKHKKMYDKIIHNPEGKYCSSTRYTKEQVINEIEGMTRSFIYLNKVFTPIKNTGLDFFEMSKNLGKIFLLAGYTNESFYETARKNYVRIVDLYSVDGKIIIPARNLYEYNEEK